MPRTGVIAVCMGNKCPGHRKPGINIYIGGWTINSFGSEFNHFGSIDIHYNPNGLLLF